MAISSSELKRKAFHNLAIVYMLLYAVTPRIVSVSVLLVALLAVGGVEFLRLRRPEINAWLIGKFGGIHRPEEIMRISGVFWTLAGSWLTVAIFVERPIVLPALGFMAFGDTAASLGGQKWGKHPWPKSPSKTIEGSLCFAVVAILWALLFVRWPVAVLAGLVAAVIEAHPIPFSLNDNFRVPLFSALVLSMLNQVLGKH